MTDYWDEQTTMDISGRHRVYKFENHKLHYLLAYFCQLPKLYILENQIFLRECQCGIVSYSD